MEKVILTPREIVLPEVSTLDSVILEDYKEGISSYKGRARKVLEIFSDKRGELAGSNCFAPIALREFLPKGTRLATMADLGRAAEINPNFLRGFFSNTGLALRTAGDSYNDFIAKDLAKQLRKRRINLDGPKVIYFDALNLRQDSNSAYGLAYDLNERAELGKNIIIDAPELLMRDFRFKTIDERGIPIKDDNGNRTCYIQQDGLARFFLDGNSDVYSYSRYLAYSGDDGRVVVVSAEGANAQKIDEYSKKLKNERDRLDAELYQRYKKAERILTGK